MAKPNFKIQNWLHLLKCILTIFVYFLFSFLGQKQVYYTGDEAVMKIHKKIKIRVKVHLWKIKIGIPEIGTTSVIASKVQWIWSWILGL